MVKHKRLTFSFPFFGRAGGRVCMRGWSIGIRLKAQSLRSTVQRMRRLVQTLPFASRLTSINWSKTTRGAISCYSPFLNKNRILSRSCELVSRWPSLSPASTRVGDHCETNVASLAVFYRHFIKFGNGSLFLCVDDVCVHSAARHRVCTARAP